MEVGNRGRLYTYRYTVSTTENDFCIKMPGSDYDESHFNVSLEGLVMDQSHKTVSRHKPGFLKKGEPKRYRTEVLPLTSLTPYC